MQIKGKKRLNKRELKWTQHIANASKERMNTWDADACAVAPTAHRPWRSASYQRKMGIFGSVGMCSRRFACRESCYVNRQVSTYSWNTVLYKIRAHFFLRYNKLIPWIGSVTRDKIMTSNQSLLSRRLLGKTNVSNPSSVARVLLNASIFLWVWEHLDVKTHILLTRRGGKGGYFDLG